MGAGHGVTAMAPWPSPARAWYLVGILMLAYVLALVDRQLLSLLVEPIRASLGVTDTQVGLLQGFAFAFFYTLFGLPLGWLADRHSRRLLLAAGVALWSAATCASAFADTFGMLFAARMFVGIGEAVLAPVAVSLIADSFPPARRPFAMGVYVSSGSVGAGLALLLGGAAITLASGSARFEPWQEVFLIVGAPGLLVALLCLTFPEPARRDSSASTVADGSLSSALATLRRLGRVLGPQIAGISVFSLMSYALFAWIPTFMLRTHGVPVTETGFWFGLAFAVCGPTGAIFGGWLARRWVMAGIRAANLRVATIAVSLAWIPYALATAVPNPWLAIALFGLGTGLSGMPSGPSLAAMQEILPAAVRGQIVAVYYFSLNLVGYGLGPLSAAWLSDHLFSEQQGLGPALGILCVLLGPLSAFLFWRARRAAEVMS